MKAKKGVKASEEVVEKGAEGEGVKEAAATEEVEQKPIEIKQKKKFHLRNLVSTKKRKIVTIIVGVIVLLLILFAIPFTRYSALSSFVKKDVTLKIVDSKTKKPVSNVAVEVGGVTAQSDKDGNVKLKAVPVGQYQLKVTKQYYQPYQTSYTVPVLTSPQSPTYDVKASGRQVSVSVTNKITGDALADVVVEANGTKATTASDGTATIILPPTQDIAKATLTKDGYNTADVELKVDDSTVNTYTVTPSGSLYYLSKATGKINVMKANLDGSAATVVVAGTGQESDYETSLLSSRDWQYSALSATRTNNKQRLYLISANKDELSLIDEGDATFNLTGWSGHNFIYTVYRNTSNVWDNKRVAIKSYNADTGKITVLDETTGAGTSSYNYVYEQLGGIYIMKDEVVYLKNWISSYPDPTKSPTLYTVSPSGGSKKTIKAFPNSSLDTRLYEPQGIYVKVNVFNVNGSTFYEYEDKAIKEVKDVNDNQFYSFYPTFLISPSGNKTLWYEPRDGKNTVFVGNDEGKDAKTIGNLSEYTPYGWYGQDDQYVLLTKNGSELYISSASKVIGDNGYQPFKVTDYHKTRTYPGYGYGYGGQ